MIDKDTKRFWKQFGQGTTNKISEACCYSNQTAVALAKLYSEQAFAVVCDGQGNPSTEHYFAWEENCPPRSQQMIDSNLVWVAFENTWYAADRQTLALSTLIAHRGGTPHVQEDEAPRIA